MSDHPYLINMLAEGAESVQHWSITDHESMIVMTNVGVVFSNVLLFAITLLVFRAEMRKINKQTEENTIEISALRRAVRALTLHMALRRYRKRIARRGLANIVRSNDHAISRISVINPTELHLIQSERKAGK